MDTILLPQECTNTAQPSASIYIAAPLDSPRLALRQMHRLTLLAEPCAKARLCPRKKHCSSPQLTTRLRAPLPIRSQTKNRPTCPTEITTRDTCRLRPPVAPGSRALLPMGFGPYLARKPVQCGAYQPVYVMVLGFHRRFPSRGAEGLAGDRANGDRRQIPRRRRLPGLAH